MPDAQSPEKSSPSGPRGARTTGGLGLLVLAGTRICKGYSTNAGALGSEQPVISETIVSSWMRHRAPLGTQLLRPFGAPASFLGSETCALPSAEVNSANVPSSSSGRERPPEAPVATAALRGKMGGVLGRRTLLNHARCAVPTHHDAPTVEFRSARCETTANRRSREKKPAREGSPVAARLFCRLSPGGTGVRARGPTP